ncbi:MAG: alpha-ribazole phosphatase family protein [Gammaproteobacteria bacterium]
MIIDETLVDLLRHGKPDPGHRYAGSLNDPLSAIGWRQMRGAVRTVAPWQKVITSPMQRCREFAEKLARDYRAPVEIIDELREIDFGDWEGREVEELMLEDDAALQAFWRDPVNNTPPGGEPLVDFQARVLTAWQAMLDECQGQHALMVCHSGVQRVIVGDVLNMPLGSLFNLETPYAGLSRVRVIESPEHGRSSSLVFHAGVR